VGQVLAILYATAFSAEPQIIAVDEPQSFLHPGAVRALLEILREHSHHQFLITTHSPVALTAARADTILLVRMDDGVSNVLQLRSGEANDLRLLLADLGVRLEDVFGFDSILWVEGPTEELCFPLIIKRLVNRPLARTGILALVAVGDLEGRHRELAFDIYNRLSKGSVLLPPAVSFIFDRERRTDERVREIIRGGSGKVSLLPRRMFENYLIDPDAIAAVASDIEGFGTLTSTSVEQWLRDRQWDAALFSPGKPPDDHSPESWFENVSGAKVLERVFIELSEARVSYDKTKHGEALTRWLLDHKPTLLESLAEFIAGSLPPMSDGSTTGVVPVTTGSLPL
jgi:energy-coupling factor transporter ATP-binding protein EcfA2